MRLGSLFSGIGGFDLAAERVGMHVAWQSEIDPYASAVLAKHWPDVPNHGDITAMQGDEIEPVDIITAGFPCQPVSLAGKQLGDADERWMWPETIRIVREALPRWFVGENVRGLLSADNGRLFGTILRDLDASGYVVVWDCIPASAVGAPHQRDRVWIVAHADSAGWQEQRGTVAVEAQQRSAERRRSSVADSNGTARRPARSTGETIRGPETIERSGRCCSSSRGFWSVEPDVGRVAHGIPRRLDRLRGLGNAIVPQVAEWIFGRILEQERMVI